MKRSIFITGASGAGKSSLANELNRRGHKAYDLEEIDGLFSMVHKVTKEPIMDHDNDNVEKVKEMDWICKIDHLRQLIDDQKQDIAFYCASMSNWEEVMPLFNLTILMKASHHSTRHRLNTRTANDFGRTSEVQDYVLSWKDWWEDRVVERGAVVVDADKDMDAVVREVLELAGAKGRP